MGTISIHATASQRAVELLAERGTEMTAQDIAQALGYMKVSMQEALRSLEHHGVVKHRKYKCEGSVNWGYKWSLADVTLEAARERSPRQVKPKYVPPVAEDPELPPPNFFNGDTPIDNWERQHGQYRRPIQLYAATGN